MHLRVGMCCNGVYIAAWQEAISWCELQGESGPLPHILDLRQILTESTTDLRQPIGLERQLLESCHATDGEVGLSMLQLLKVSHTRLTLLIPVHCHREEQYMRTVVSWSA